MAKFNFEFKPVNLGASKKALQSIIDKKMNDFLFIFKNKATQAADEIHKSIQNSDLADFIKNEGQGELGIIEPETTLSILGQLLKQSAINDAEIRAKNGKATVFVQLLLAEKELMRVATRYFWTNTSGDSFEVNLFSIIEGENLSEAGIRGGKVEGFEYLEGVSTEFSRTGEGIMVPAEGRDSYQLPLKHLGGFSDLIKGMPFLRILVRLMKQSLREAGFKTRG